MSRDIEESLVETIEKPDLTDLAAELAELGLDELLENESLKAIPIVGHLLRVYKGVLSLRDYLFVKKVGRFLLMLREVPESERKSFSERVGQDEDFRHRVGENLTLLLDRLDQMEKSDLVGRLFAHYLGGRITFDDFQELATGVDRAFMSDLLELKDGSFSDNYVETRLLACGLVEMERGIVTLSGMSSLGFRISSLGESLVKLCLEDFPSEVE